MYVLKTRFVETITKKKHKLIYETIFTLSIVTQPTVECRTDRQRFIDKYNEIRHYFIYHLVHMRCTYR